MKENDNEDESSSSNNSLLNVLKKNNDENLDNSLQMRTGWSPGLPSGFSFFSDSLEATAVGMLFSSITNTPSSARILGTNYVFCLIQQLIEFLLPLLPICSRDFGYKYQTIHSETVTPHIFLQGSPLSLPPSVLNSRHSWSGPSSSMKTQSIKFHRQQMQPSDVKTICSPQGTFYF